MAPETYDVFAIQYATSTRARSEYFLSVDAHDGPAPINYYIWVIRNAERVVVVDTGFDAARAIARKRDFIRCPTEGLRALGIDARSVETVIITHLHYDHAGNLDKFPSARFILQDEEMRFATGRSMRFKLMSGPFDVADVQAMVRNNYEGRVRFVDGTAQIAPGICVHRIPGHSKGLQAVTVRTARGVICLASDAAHFYANVTSQRPFPILADVAGALEGHEAVLGLVDGLQDLVPGHDPLVGTLFPRHSADPLIWELSAAPLRPCPPLEPGGGS